MGNKFIYFFLDDLIECFAFRINHAYKTLSKILEFKVGDYNSCRLKNALH